MSFKKIYTAVAMLMLAVAAFGLLTSCHREKTYRIGVSQCSEDDWRQKMNSEILQELMFHPEAEVEIRSADDSNAKQIADLRYFADNGFDVVVVAPNEAVALTPVIRELHEKGVKMLVFDRNIKGDYYEAFIGADNVSLGTAAARYSKALLGKRIKAIELYGLPGSTPADHRHIGFTSQFAPDSSQVVASVAANWQQQRAIEVTESLLKVHPEVNLIYAHNDRMAIGASEVTHSLGRDSIKIIGIDAAPAIGVQAVVDSVIDATFLYPTKGQELIQTALAIAKGEPYTKETFYDVKSVVDRSNADILLFQDETLRSETAKMTHMKQQMDAYWASHSSQTGLFYASIAIIVLLCVVLFLLIRAFWQNRRHQYMLLEQNRLLEEQRDKERELNDKLKQATQSKLMFFTNVSHDLRTPLTLISEPVEQVASASNLTEQQRSLMKIAAKNVKILRRLINQILDFRKYENDRLDLHLQECDLSRSVEEWAATFRGVARKRHIRLKVEVDTEPPVTGAFDAEKMERVIFNLLSNSFKHTPDNGAIVVGCHEVDGKAVITVEDTGEGISEDDLKNVFDRFFQADSVNPHGSGIGLALIKAFVELHGGTVKAESSLGRGSRFTVEIPIEHVAETPAVSAAEAVITAEDVDTELEAIDAAVDFEEGKPLLLVIDDNSDIRQLVGQLMGDSYNILMASDGREGLRKATRYVPDLIICDVMMPVIDGLECTRAIKSEISTSHIPVLLLTARSRDEERAEGYSCGADGYISKPFTAEVLKARCRSLLDNRRRIIELYSEAAASPSAPKGKGRASEANGSKGAAAPVSSPQKARKAPVSDIDSDFYNKFLELVEADLGNPEMNVDSLAARMGLGRSQFYRKIKALTNFSPVELLRNMRLKQARTLLTTTEKNISEIAYEVGFSTPAYFTRCYREAFGETPTELRERLQGK